MRSDLLSNSISLCNMFIYLFINYDYAHIKDWVKFKIKIKQARRAWFHNLCGLMTKTDIQTDKNVSGVPPFNICNQGAVVLLADLDNGYNIFTIGHRTSSIVQLFPSCPLDLKTFFLENKWCAWHLTTESADVNGVKLTCWLQVKMAFLKKTTYDIPLRESNRIK